MELYLHVPYTSSWHGAQLKKKHRENFTFTSQFNNYTGQTERALKSWYKEHITSITNIKGEKTCVR
jgi:hypothetical protein